MTFNCHNNYFLKRKCNESQGKPWLFCFSWEQRKLGDMGSTYTGLSGKTKDDFGHGNGKFVTYMNVFLNPVSDPDRTESVEIDSAQNEVHYGDVFFTTSSETPEEVGMSSVWLEKSENTYLNSFCFGYRPCEDIDPFYMAYMLRSEAVRNKIVFLAQGISRYNISKTGVMEIAVPIPDLPEQKRIGDYFKQLDNLITLHQREEKSHTVGPTCIATAWEQREFGDIGSVSMCKRIFKEETTDVGEIPFYKIGTFGSVPDAYISRELYEEYRSKYSYPHKGDILLSASGTIGRIVEYNGEEAYFQDSNIVWLSHDETISNLFLKTLYPIVKWNGIEGSTIKRLYNDNFLKTQFMMPTLDEQTQIGAFFANLDHLITLHQREHNHINTEVFMLSEIKANDKFCDYYAQWISVYKEGAVRKVTMDKYKNTHSWLVKLIPELSICELNRVTYQQLLNNYARYHERQTTMDFHHQLKGAIQDAVDDGLIEKDPTRKAIIKGKTASEKKTKYLNQFELHTLLSSLDLKGEINWDWFILLVAKTGMRFSEALALTPKDFDFAHQTLSISKTWDYKGTGGFLPTKNKSSVRKIQIDWQTVIQFSELVRRLPQDEPIFVKKDNVYNSTVNDILERHCKKAGVPVITVHGLRHTHASLLLFAGVSIASVARRLGHASMTTTQKTYLHIIQELENQDVDLVMRSLSGLS